MDPMRRGGSCAKAATHRNAISGAAQTVVTLFVTPNLPEEKIMYLQPGCTTNLGMLLSKPARFLIRIAANPDLSPRQFN
jgi:hypothetical protein